MNNKPTIIFEAERMKNPHTGMFHYCLELGKALIGNQPEHEAQLAFYLPFSAVHNFKEGIKLFIQKRLHRVHLPISKDVIIWHCTNQHTRYFPNNKKLKIALTIHDLNFLVEKQSHKKQQRYLQALQKKVNGANAIITISEFVKTEIETHLDIGNKKVNVIYNGCNIPEEFTTAPVTGITFPFIFSIGTITPKKNFHVLPATIMENNLHVVIAGIVQNKEYLKKIFDEAKRLGVSDRVHYIGPVEEKQKYWLLQNCSLFCFPSLAEGFGLPVIEAMRFGKPVLLSDATSLPEVGGELATYMHQFDASHISALANASLDGHSEAKAKLLIEWSKKFDWRNTAAAYWKIYEELLSQAI